MHNDKYEIIEKIMEMLQAEMEDSPDDLNMRLGREKPKVEMLSVEAGGDMPPNEDEDIPMDEDDELKERLMQVRG